MLRSDLSSLKARATDFGATGTAAPALYWYVRYFTARAATD